MALFNPPLKENFYPLHTDNPMEMMRLVKQDKLATRSLGGLFPEDVVLPRNAQILDIGCGIGSWACEVAYMYPDYEVIGVDVSQTFVEYAEAMAQVQGLQNVQFRMMDVTEVLDFPENSFDFVNTRFVMKSIPTANWGNVLHECLRVLRPGGILHMAETDDIAGVTNSIAVETLREVGMQALQRSGTRGVQEGRYVVITPMLGRFLRESGYEDIQKKAHMIDWSASERAHLDWYQIFTSLLLSKKDFLTRIGVIDDEEFDELYRQAMIDMMDDDFVGIVYFLSIYGHKPACL